MRSLLHCTSSGDKHYFQPAELPPTPALLSKFMILPGVLSSLYRMTELLSRIEYGNRGIFTIRLLVWVDQFFQEKKA